MSPFSLTINGLRGFPSLQRPRILCVGVSGEVESLQVLVPSIESMLRPLGFTQEGKPFHPHLTLSRIKSRSREIGKFLEASDLCRNEWRFGELTVD